MRACWRTFAIRLRCPQSRRHVYASRDHDCRVLWRKMNSKETTTRDQDIHKGATEDERPSGATNAPALDANGLPNDEKRIAEDSVGAREDGTQG